MLMTRFTVLIAPNPILRKKAEPVALVDDSIKKLLKDMEETMNAEDGIGLAAPQIGISKRLIVMNVPANVSVAGEMIDNLESEPSLFFLVNPEIVSKSDDFATCQEGCLSVPKQYADVVRYASVVVRYRDENGKLSEREFKNLQSACIQHEIDHLDGKLFVDYLSTLKRDMLIRKANRFVQRL